MSKTIHLLIVEDSPDDAQILVFQLEESGLEVHWQRVETEEDFLAALDPHLDLILADYSLPSFSGIRALQLRNERGLDIPFILVSGTVGEDVAVLAMQHGAADYLLKDRLARLGEAVRHALEQKQLREEKRRSEQALRESEERLRVLSEAAHDLTTVVNRDWIVEYTNSYAAELFGVSPQDLVGKRISEIFPAEIAARQQTSLQNVFDSGQAQYVEAPSIFQGKTIWLGSWLVPIKDKLGEEANAILIVSRDITDRKRAEEALRRSEEKYRRLTENAVDIVFRYDLLPEMRLTYINPAVEKITGYSPQECLADPYLMLSMVHPDDLPKMAEYTAAPRVPDEPLFMRWTAKDGFVRWMESRMVQIQDESGQLVAVEGITRDITERKLAEENLREAESRYRTLVEQVPAITYRAALDSSKTRTYISPQVESMLGYSPAESLADADLWRRMIHPDDFDRVMNESRNFYETGDPFASEYRLRARDGRIVWVNDQALIARDEVGQPLFIQGIQTDITERKQAQERLRDSEMRFQALIEHNNDVITVLDRQAAVIYVSNSLTRSFGYRPEEVQGGGLGEYLHPDEAASFGSIWTEILESPGRVIRLEFRIRLKDGAWRWVESSAQNLLAETSVQGVVLNSRDITERKQAEKALQASETRYRLATRATNDIIWEWSPETRELVWSENAQHVFGYSPEEIGPDEMWWDEHIHPDDRQRVLSNMDALLEGSETIWSEEYRFLLKDGSYAHISDHGYIERDPNGDALRMIGAMSDVTERTRAEERIQRQLERLNALREIDQAITSTFDMRVSLNVLLSRALKLLAVDAAAVLLLNAPLNTLEYQATIGFRTSAPQGSSIRLGESYAGKAALEQRLVQVPNLTHEPDPLFPTGCLRGEGFVSYHGAPLVTKGKVVGVLEVFSRSMVRRDQEWLDFLGTLAGQAAIAIDNAQLFAVSQRELAERRLAEEALRASHAELERRVEERTAELSRVNLELERSVRIKDEFLANMSHELRTPLNAIIGLSESLEEQTAGSLNEKQQKYVHIIRESGHHLLDLINDILDIAKIESGQFTLERRKLDVSSICESSLRMIRPLAQKKNQELVLDVEESLDLIWADERRLKQMLVNLLNNAVKFTPEQGRIGLAARGDRETNTVSFTVWDTGIGIREEDMASLFRPFVQLNSELAHKNPGTGLGLALVAQMARLHGGSVGVESHPGQGSRFTLTLPWESPLATDSTSRIKMNGRFRVVKPEDKNDKQTILLVEDTAEVIMVIRDYLEYAGYKVVVAHNGVDGIAQAQRFHPDLILMDVQMPDMDGLEATRRLRRQAQFEHTPILALTALAMKGDRERCLEAGMDEYLSKPVNLKALVRMVQNFI